jgi:hypothetical protein
MAKPVIVFVDRPDGLYREARLSLECEALSYIFTRDYGCDVLLFDNLAQFEGKLERIKCLAESGFVMLLIITQDEYSNFPKRFIELIRQNINNPQVPIAVFANWTLANKFEGNANDKHVFVFNSADTDFLEFAEKLRANFKIPVNFYGVETEAEQALLLQQLERSYQVNYLGENEIEGRGVIPDHNTQIVVQALRIRILPAELTKQEFEDTFDHSPTKFEVIENSLYDAEYARIKSMGEEDFKRYRREILWAEGYEELRDGGLRAFRGGCDPGTVQGYAIDPITLEFVITKGHGSHKLAQQALARRLMAIEGLKKTKFVCGLSHKEEYAIEGRIVVGLIFTKILNLQTPLLKLFQRDVEDEDFTRIVDFLYQQKKFIPIYPSGKIIRG